jgi:hypothetical protein
LRRVPMRRSAISRQKNQAVIESDNSLQDGCIAERFFD